MRNHTDGDPTHKSERIWMGFRKMIGAQDQKKLWVIGILVIVYGLLAIYIYKQWEIIVAFQWQLKWNYIGSLVVTQICSFTLMAWAWHYAMRRVSGAGNWRLDTRIYAISFLARRIPLPIWSIGSRVYLYRKERIRGSYSLIPSSLEFGLNIIDGLIYYCLLIPWHSQIPILTSQLVVALTFFLISMLLIRPNIFTDLVNWVLRRLRKTAIPPLINRQDLLILGLVYLLTWALGGFGIYFTTAALIPSPPPLGEALSVASIYGLVMVASSLLPAGFGLKEISLASLLSLWMPVPAGLVFAFIYRIAQTLVETVIALVTQLIPLEKTMVWK